MDHRRGLPRAHELDFEESERPTKRRSRSAVACQRCKSRKQRCDNEFPSCSNCLSARVSCSYGLKQIYPAEYVRALENHVAQIERGSGSDPKPTVDSERAVTGEVQENLTPSGTSVDSINNDSVAEDLETSLETGVGFVAISPNSYLGTSSGFPLAKLVSSAIDIPHRDRNRNQGASSRGKGRASALPYASSPVPRSARHQDPNSDTRKADMPSDEIASKLIGAYLSKVHPKHPFLSRRTISMLSKNRANLAPACQSSSSASDANRLSYAVLHLVYAIGARYMQLANNDGDYPSPEAHYAAALTDVDEISDMRSLENLEAMLLLSIYQLRSPTGPGIWWMIGTTMRHCLDCGLHRRSPSGTSPVLDQRRKRIFWTAYMLERSVARTVGRPYSVADRDIDVALPANIDDSWETDEEVETAIMQAEANSNQHTPLTAAIHIIRVQQIESNISHTLCRVDKPIGSIRPDKITKLRNALEEWKANIPRATGSDTGEKQENHAYNTIDYHMIQYHKALVLLFLPSLPSLTPSHPDYRHVAYSAGQISQLYKRLHDNQSYISFSLLALHANFVAGLVLVYCFCLDPGLFDTHFSSDIRACSTMLYSISERWPAARKVRKAFESLVAATIEGDHGRRGQRDHNRTARDRDGRGNEHLVQHNMGSYVRQGSDRDTDYRATDSVWNNFEMVLEDYQINAETWMQDSIFQAMDAVPVDGSTMWGDVW